jgi:hypothetical protein
VLHRDGITAAGEVSMPEFTGSGAAKNHEANHAEREAAGNDAVRSDAAGEPAGSSSHDGPAA